MKKIADLLREKGAKEVLGENPDASVPGLEHARALATRGGIYDADVVLIPLEDGDRCEALVAMGKKVIAIDLNPLSRTARKATVSIVDNILRAVPNMTDAGPAALGTFSRRSGEDGAGIRQRKSAAPGGAGDTGSSGGAV